MASKFFRNFILCGTIGWCLEIVFTALHSLKRREMALHGTTSLWMFPIYGLGAFIPCLKHFLKEKNVFFRGSIYMLFIFFTEFLSGSYLTKKKSCPWDYHRHRWHIGGVIRLDYAPWWFLTGLLFEHVLSPCHETSSSLSEHKRLPKTHQH